MFTHARRGLIAATVLSVIALAGCATAGATEPPTAPSASPTATATPSPPPSTPSPTAPADTRSATDRADPDGNGYGKDGFPPDWTGAQVAAWNRGYEEGYAGSKRASVAEQAQYDDGFDDGVERAAEDAGEETEEPEQTDTDDFDKRAKKATKGWVKHQSRYLSDDFDAATVAGEVCDKYAPMSEWYDEVDDRDGERAADYVTLFYVTRAQSVQQADAIGDTFVSILFTKDVCDA